MKNSTRKEIERLEGLEEVRMLQDNTEKAAYILRYYSLDCKIHNKDIETYFNISNTALRKRLWSNILGYKSHGKDKPKYLPPFLEHSLLDLVIKCKNEMKCLTKDELLKEVL